MPFATVQHGHGFGLANDLDVRAPFDEAALDPAHIEGDAHDAVRVDAAQVGLHQRVRGDAGVLRAQAERLEDARRVRAQLSGLHYDVFSIRYSLCFALPFPSLCWIGP